MRVAPGVAAGERARRRRARRELVSPPGASTGSATGLRAVAWAPDGTIEAIEAVDARLRARRPVARRDAGPRGPHQRLFEAFVAAAAPPEAFGRLRCAVSASSSAGTGRRTAARWSGWARRWRRAARTEPGCGSHGGRRAGPPAAGDHRSLRARRAADARCRARADGRLQRLHLQPPRAARGAAARSAHRFVSTSDTEVLLKGWAEWGEDLPSAPLRHVRVRAAARTRAAAVLVRDRLGVKPLYLAERRRRAARRLDAARAAGRRRRGHERRPGRAAPLPELALGRAGAADDPARASPSCRRPRCCVVEPDGTRRETLLLGPAVRAHARRLGARRTGRDAVREALRAAVRRRMVADVPVGILLSGGLDSSLIVALLAEEGQRGLATFSHRLPATSAGARATSSSSPTSSPSEFGTEHHKLRDRRRERMVPALRGAIAAMSEPMVSHDCVAFYLLSRGGGRESQGRAVRARAPTRCSPATRGTRRCAEAPGRGADTYAAEFFDRDDAGVAELLAVAAGRRRPSRAFARDWFERPGAATAGRPRAAAGHRGDARRGSRSSAWTT